MNTFIQQGCIKLMKSEIKGIYNVNKYLYFKVMPFELSVHQRILKKMYHVYTKILSVTTVFNIHNYRKCFLRSKSEYYNNLLKDHVKRKCISITGVN